MTAGTTTVPATTITIIIGITAIGTIAITAITVAIAITIRTLDRTIDRRQPLPAPRPGREAAPACRNLTGGAEHRPLPRHGAEHRPLPRHGADPPRRNRSPVASLVPSARARTNGIGSVADRREEGREFSLSPPRSPAHSRMS